MDIVWDQKDFEKLMDSLSPERKEADQKSLTALFNKAAKSPTLKAEIEWAHQHGIKFFVDRTSQGVGGYYMEGTGVVSIAEQHIDLSFGIEVLAHEIRHAWQDYNGLLPDMTEQDFLSYYTLVTLAEADATAFQKAAIFEYYTDVSRTNALWDGFSGWYSSYNAASYGDTAAKQYAKKIDIKDAPPPPDRKFEFNYAASPVRREEDLSLKQVIPLLNKDFSGKEWFNTAAASRLFEKVLDRTAAAKFYQIYMDEPVQLVQEICKKQGLSF